MASTILTKSAATPTNRKKYTVSFWCKKALFGINQYVLNTASDGSNRLGILFNTSEQLEIYGQTSGSENAYVRPTRLFKDASAFYHFVIAVDTTQSTAADRVKIYVNGTLETVMTSTNYPSQNADLESHRNHYIGGYGVSSNYYFGGCLAHFHFTDGYTYDASTFGETDSTSGIWKPKTSPSVNYGNVGYFLKFENSGNLDLDSSGNNISFSTSGTLTQNTDTPTNNTCIWNRNFLTRFENGSTTVPGMLENGNTAFNSTANQFYGYRAGTLGVTSGKWYWENKIIDNGRMQIGICYPNTIQEVHTPPYDSQLYTAVTINNSGEVYGRYTGSAIDTYASSVSFSNNDIIGFALDMNNKALYIHKNGSYVNSGNPASGASRTGSVIEELTGTRDSYLGSGEFVSPFVGDPSSSGTFHVQSNFGSGFFGTTAVASANADANGHGAFEYAVPSGYYTLNTKNLKEFG